MGNEQSSGIEIDEKAVEVCDFWTQHSASIPSLEKPSNLSVFVGEVFVNGPLWTSKTPLEKSSKNLMIYRHPYILRYITSWQKNSKFYLAVEELRPLSHVLPQLNALEICIGLHSILKALCFLHEKAQVSHNNVCISSIYVTKNGSWKMGGMEYLCRYADLNCDYLIKSRSNRYNKAIDPNEDKNILTSPDRKDFIDAYAFGVLASELLKTKKDGGVVALASFKELCEKFVQNISVSQRPQLNALLEHDFFNQEFIEIHSFLNELPLKRDDEKTRFFLTLAERLKGFDEGVVGSQLGSLLLSRLVLLNHTAQTHFLPVVLSPRQGFEDQTKGLFNTENFKKYLKPKLFEIFCVRDAQIRLLLLSHFTHYMLTFTKEELQADILPELLLGIKDTNDHLVSVTLKILAELVPVLGAKAVIGGKRGRLFMDGRPTQQTGSKPLRNRRRGSNQPHLETIIENDSTSSGLESTVILPERPRPDGEEGDSSTEEVEQSMDEDLDNWEDWDLNENNHERPPTATSDLSENNVADVPGLILDNEVEGLVPLPSTATPLDVVEDINRLDIKNQRNYKGSREEIDFFLDMEPVIEVANKFVIESELNGTVDLEKQVSSKLLLNVGDDHEDGWVDEDWE